MVGLARQTRVRSSLTATKLSKNFRVHEIHDVGERYLAAAQ